MKQVNIKKLILLNLPYLLVGLFATNLGEAWRLAQGANASEKMLELLSALPAAFGNPFPSFHPLDLLIGMVQSTAPHDGAIMMTSPPILIRCSRTMSFSPKQNGSL